MTRQQSALTTFGIIITAGSAIAMIVSFTAWLGYVLGALTTLGAAVIAGCDLD